MYWYNPTISASERAQAPATDEQAIRMLDGHPASATFVSEYAKLRRSGTPIESLGVGGPRGAVKAARSHAGAPGGARGASEQEEVGEAEFRRVRAPFGAAPSGGGHGSPKR
jgi:hypothetical protein